MTLTTYNSPFNGDKHPVTRVIKGGVLNTENGEDRLNEILLEHGYTRSDIYDQNEWFVLMDDGTLFEFKYSKTSWKEKFKEDGNKKH